MEPREVLLGAGARPSKNGGYRLLRSRGRGGFAEVFEAEPRGRPGELVAFKRAVLGESARNRMRREIQVQRNLPGSPHIVEILDAAPDEGWLVMPLAEGSLENLWPDHLQDVSAETLAEEVLHDVGEGLRVAHASGIAHRDVTPGNILMYRDHLRASERRWAVGDWGLVRRPHGATMTRHTATGEALGTLGFAAPETWEDGHTAGPPADVYGLGRVLGWILTGQRPTPNRPLLPSGSWRGLIAEATRDDTASRPGDAGALLRRHAELSAVQPATPRAELAGMVQRALDSAAIVDVSRLLQLAEDTEDQADVYFDDLSPLPGNVVAEATHQHPQRAARVAARMAHHLRHADWGRRDFNKANVPLGFIHAALTTLIQDCNEDLAEDLAVEFFQAEEHWNRFDQLRRTSRWLRNLTEKQAQPIARALRRSGKSRFYAEQIGRDNVLSRTLRAELNP